MKKQISLFLSVIAAFSFFSYVRPYGLAYAQTTPTATGPEEDCAAVDISAANCKIIDYINVVFNVISALVVLAVIGNIIYAGIRYSTAQGDPGAASAAKKRIREAIIAFLMYIALYSFIQWLVPGGVF